MPPESETAHAAQKPGSRFANPRVAWVASIVATVLLFCILEGGARGWFWLRVGIPFWETSQEDTEKVYDRTHPYLPVIFRKSTRLTRSTQEVVINNIGFRGPDVIIPKPAGALRVATLGGSTTFGAGVVDANTWSRVIERLLRQRYPGRTIEVINAGVPGYNSMEDLINLETRVLPLAPDIVIEYQAYNDMKAHTRSARFEPDYSDWRNRADPHDNWAEWMADHSRLFFGAFILAQRISPPNRKNTSTILFQDRGQIASFERNIANITALCKAHRIVPILATFNLALDTEFINGLTSIEIKPSEYRVMLRAYNEAIRRVSRERDAILVDADLGLPDDLTIHSDICHLTEKGNEALARLFVARITELPQLHPSPAP